MYIRGIIYCSRHIAAGIPESVVIAAAIRIIAVHTPDSLIILLTGAHIPVIKITAAFGTFLLHQISLIVGG
jgi:hypothetical protein